MISKKAEYAIKILAELARRGENRFQSSREVARAHEIPPTLVAQLVSQMQKKGLIESSRGARGGIRLAVDPREITIKQAVEIFDGTIGISRCLKAEDYCPKSTTCPLHQIWKRAQGKMVLELEQTSIYDFSRFLLPGTEFSLPGQAFDQDHSSAPK